MPALEAVLPFTDPWPRRRERAHELADRYPHAAEMLRLYQALVTPQAEAFQAARVNKPQGDDLVPFVVEQALPGIIDATVAAGPLRLRDGVVGLFATADLHALIRRWLAGDALSPIETYLARTSTGPVLEAMATGSSLSLTSLSPVESRGATCPHCGGLPQLSYFSLTGETLVSGPRYLVCSRCGWNWTFSRMTCAGCGESTGAKLPIYQEGEQFAHIRVDGCSSCHRYLLTFDLRRDSRTVPVVDELAALPLDLYARDQGLTKITPNLMGN